MAVVPTLEELKGRSIPLADAPVVYHLWAAYEKVEHMIGESSYKNRMRADILGTLDRVTRDH